MDMDQRDPEQVAYARRNRDLDPQLVWRGKDEQDWSDLVVHVPPLYIQEKVQPKVLEDDLMRRTETNEKSTDPQPDPAPGWSPDEHRIKAPLEYSRGPDKVWVFGVLRVGDGKTITFTSRSRDSKGYLKLLEKIVRSIPRGTIYVIADNLTTHKSAMVRQWPEEHPRIDHAFIPKGAAWLNLIEAWWRLFRRQALTGVDFADGYEVDKATRVATRQLNRKASPWVWGRKPKPPRYRRRTFVYRI
jgi:transposase